jgi:DTW domain-containing protein YfiP
MSRRDHREERCRECRLHATLCICAIVPRIETRTRVVLVIHRSEMKKPTGSGLLGARCLAGSEVLVRGETEPPRFSRDERQPVILFPHEAAISLGSFTQPLTLIVPDGTWRQAAKVSHRVGGLENVPFVSLPPEPAVAGLRSQSRPDRLSTLQAMARALGVLEGAHVRDALERIFRVFHDRTRWMRGALPTERVSGGIPDAALKDDPRGAYQSSSGSSGSARQRFQPL